MTARERLEKAERSLSASREAVTNLKGELAAKEEELSTAVLEVEVGSGQKRKVERLEKEAQVLRDQIVEHERSIAVLEGALPQLRREAETERAGTEGVESYRRARDRYVELIASLPPLETLTALLGELRDYVDRVVEAQADFFSTGKALNTEMLKLGLDEIGGIGSETLRADRGIDHRGIVHLGDNLDMAATQLEELSNGFMGLLLSLRDETFKIEEPRRQAVTESCPGGCHERWYDPKSNMWTLNEIKWHPIDLNKPPEVVLVGTDSGFEDRPAWPCEKPKQPEATVYVSQPRVVLD